MSVTSPIFGTNESQTVVGTRETKEPPLVCQGNPDGIVELPDTLSSTLRLQASPGCCYRQTLASSNTSPCHPVWRLQGARAKLVECLVQQTISKLYTVIVLTGSETLLDEMYPDAVTAMRRATQVRDRLTERGDWTVAHHTRRSGPS